MAASRKNLPQYLAAPAKKSAAVTHHSVLTHGGDDASREEDIHSEIGECGANRSVEQRPEGPPLGTRKIENQREIKPGKQDPVIRG